MLSSRNSTHVKTIPSDRLRQIRENCFEVCPFQLGCLGHLLFEGSCLLHRTNGTHVAVDLIVDDLSTTAKSACAEVPMSVLLRKNGLELRPFADGPGQSTIALSLSPMTVVTSSSAAECQSRASVSLRSLWLPSATDSHKLADIDLVLESRREADIFARCTKAALEDLCRTCLAYALPPNLAETAEVADALPLAVGAALVSGYMLYSGPKNRAEDTRSVSSESPTLAVVFVELCSPPPASDRSEVTHGVRCHSLRIYVDQSRTDCLAAVYIGPGSEIDYSDDHCSFAVQERLWHILVVGSSKKAALWVELLRLLCSVDAMDSGALEQATKMLSTKAADLKAEDAFDHEGCCSSELLRFSERSPFLPAKPRPSQPTLLTGSQHSLSKSRMEDSLDVAAALLDCGGAQAKPSDTCIVEMTCESNPDVPRESREQARRRLPAGLVVANEELSDSARTDFGEAYRNLVWKQ